MCTVLYLEANWFQLYQGAHDVTDIINWLEIYSKFYTKAGFEPTIHLRLRDFQERLIASSRLDPIDFYKGAKMKI